MPYGRVTIVRPRYAASKYRYSKNRATYWRLVKAARKAARWNTRRRTGSIRYVGHGKTYKRFRYSTQLAKYAKYR